ncbi:fumarylacetoacetase [Aquibium sp. LZ166]|uniref:fumarylacetoacetase n=1 Tax=Aquibium pacificus TaxID=3153579 RepID=A0ABV3SL97_9HYPH
MTNELDRTHDAAARCWVTAANAQTTPFPIQNLPFGRIEHPRLGRGARVVVAIGDRALDVAAAAQACGFTGLAGEAAAACSDGDLNALIALSPAHATVLRHALFDSLHESTPADDRAPESALVPISEAQLLLPMAIGDYTDFFCSMHHAMNASRIFKGPETLRPNFHYLPIGYHGRASSVVVSGTDIRRPMGELPPLGDAPPPYAPCAMLDYEVELGIVVRGGNTLGETIPIDRAEDAIFGACLQNDWSARDIQRWESMPLGPFLSKSFATSISPWIVTVDALRPFRVRQKPRGEDIPQPPLHLRLEDDTTWSIDIDCAIETATMRAAGSIPQRISTSRLVDMHWSPKQMVTHHASNGCNLRPGDLMGSGTISGIEKDSWGCLLERTHDGHEPIAVGSEQRGYLADGDRVVMSGRCNVPGARAIGFGSCEGTILPATGQAPRLQ